MRLQNVKISTRLGILSENDIDFSISIIKEYNQILAIWFFVIYHTAPSYGRHGGKDALGANTTEEEGDESAESCRRNWEETCHLPPSTYTSCDGQPARNNQCSLPTSASSCRNK